MRKIGAIFFDLGKVIINFDMGILEKGYEPYGYVPDGRLLDYILESDNGVKYMQGEITSSQFYNKTRRYFKMKIKTEEFYRIWNSIFSPYPEVEGIVRNIKKKYPDIPLALVSDTNESHYGFLREKYEVLGLFDHYVLSHETGKLKPHPDVYKQAMRLTGTLAKDIFYTDDRPELIKAARVLGLHAFQFTGHEALREQLARFGVNA